MIIKKPWRRVKCREWDRDTKKFQSVTTVDYVGYFLFGFIPLYLIKVRSTIGDSDLKIETYVGDYKDYLLGKK